MEKALELLQHFLTERTARRIPDDLLAPDSRPQKTEQVTDFYLAALADKHGIKLATLDEKNQSSSGGVGGSVGKAVRSGDLLTAYFRKSKFPPAMIPGG